MTETETNKRWKLALNIITVTALIGLCYAIRGQIFDTIENLGKVNAWALLLIFPIEFWNYDAYARMYRQIFAVLGEKTKYKDMLKIALELNLVNHIFPSGGVSGFSYFSLRLKQQGISTGKATLVQLMKLVLLFASFEVLLLIGILCLALGGRVNNLTILIASSLATLLVVATFGSAFIIGSQKRINSFFTYVTQVLNRLIQVVRPNNPETINVLKVQNMFNELHDNYVLLKSDYHKLIQPFIFALIANLTEIMALYAVYIAFGHWVNPGAIILAYAVANFAGLVSVLPGGIGIYEALMTAVLVAAGVPASLSIPVTVMYRVVNITIQVVPGYYYYHKALRHNQAVPS
jgi:uncharacterized protein (TIRG00374 family)